MAHDKLKKLKKEYPLLNDIISLKEIFWSNSEIIDAKASLIEPPFGLSEVQEAERRLIIFSPYIMKVFPETKKSNGIIESPLE